MSAVRSRPTPQDRQGFEAIILEAFFFWYNIGTTIPDISTTKGLEKLKNLSLHLFESQNEEDLKLLIKAWEIIDGNVNTFPKALTLIEEFINTSNYYLENLDVKTLVLQDINQFKETWKQYSMDSSTDTKSLAGFRNQIALGIPVSKKSEVLALR